MIAFEDATASFGGAAVVRGVTLTIADGEFLALIGPSGSGKSTTLRMINRLVPCSAGAVTIDGMDVRAIEATILRRRMGYVIQSVGLFPHWTVARNIATVPRLIGWADARVDARVVELMAMLRLDPTFAGRYPHELSGGQQQRVGVARALAADPAVLLMDEPFGALDPVTRDGLQAMLEEIRRATGKTIVMVTHDMNEALRLADRIAVMEDGRVAQLGTPRDLIEAPATAFVRDAVGRDERGLRLLATETVASRMRDEAAGSGVVVAPDTSLRRALAIMAETHVDRLDVASDGSHRGVLHASDCFR